MLKKLVSLFLMICLVLSVSVTAFASIERAFSDCNLYLDNGYVHCKGQVYEDGSEIALTMKLYRNGRTIRTWNATGYDLVQMDETYPAVSGSTYQLSFVCYVDGNSVTMPTKTLVCP